MRYGPRAPNQLPPQDHERLILCLDRFSRADQAMQKWAEKAKEAVDFLEGRQWSEADLARMKAQGRPALTINKTNRLVRLMLGYFSNNKIDIRYLPGDDLAASDQIAEDLTKLAKQVSEMNESEFSDTEVFLDGLSTGRGFWDSRLSFENNDFGEIETLPTDPFTVRLDPDGWSYDLNRTCAHVSTSRMASIDEVEWLYGKTVREQVEPFVFGQTPLTQYWLGPYETEKTPIRRFGYSEEEFSEWWDNLYNYLGNFVDPLRKSLRVFDMQHYELAPARMFVDAETGDRSEIPENWDREKIEKAIWWASTKGRLVLLDERPTKRVRWTTIIGDLMVYDNWSPYTSYTLTPYFPYFRRGVTRGMVEDLMDPNREINKKRSARTDAIMRTAHSGWKYHEKSLDPTQEANLKRHGSEAGFNMKWRGDPRMEPKKIESSAPPTGLRELEVTANDDMLEVSGINESALGQLDIGQSGRAIEARQRQSVISVQTYLTNFSRSKQYIGRKYVELFQEHYTEARIFRVLGDDGESELLQINQPGLIAGEILHNITIGKYRVAIDEQPLAATAQSAQFEEMLEIISKLGVVGQMLWQMRPDLVVEMSSLPRKEEWKQALIDAATAVSQGLQPGGPAPAPSNPPGKRGTPDGGPATSSTGREGMPSNVVPMPTSGAQ